MRFTRSLIPTLKEAPAEAQVVSHILLVRAGYNLLTRFLPEAPPEWSAIHIRHLLTHTSGIREYGDDAEFDVRRSYTDDGLVLVDTGGIFLGRTVKDAIRGWRGDSMRAMWCRMLC